MHPYRTDLEGNDVSLFVDPEGTLLFKEFVRVVSRQDAGYVEYLWQWKDDQEHIVPKISYVKLFAPWDWIIGTGVYLEDIRLELELIIKRVVMILLGVLMLVLFLSLYIIRNSFRQINSRMLAEGKLNEYKDHLEELVEQRTAELQKALSQVKTLKGFIPICASCKKIRDDQGFWKQLESYLRAHSEAEFSHGICPDCAKILYPEYYKEEE